MPVKSFRSSVIKWPNRQEVEKAVRRWAEEIKRLHADIVRIGYFGSYARGEWGVGSDVDLLVIVSSSELPRERRTLSLRAESLPVPADVLVYTIDEWQRLSGSGTRFAAMIARDTVWL